MRKAQLADLFEFIVVADHHSFTRAAVLLGISTAALRRTIRAVEDCIGMRLLNRTSRSVAPTPAGERLLERLRPVLRGLVSTLEEVKYTTSAIAVGGRDGNTGTTDGKFEVKLALPKELGGKGDGNNPEQLFAAGYAACFLSSMQFLASQDGTILPRNAEVMVTVKLGPRFEGGLGLEAAIDVTLPGLAQNEAEALIERAHRICAYSNAMRDGVTVKLSVIEA
jgi:Ohr subfamily peroxiredoxin